MQQLIFKINLLIGIKRNRFKNVFLVNSHHFDLQHLLLYKFFFLFSAFYSFLTFHLVYFDFHRFYPILRKNNFILLFLSFYNRFPQILIVSFFFQKFFQFNKFFRQLFSYFQNFRLSTIIFHSIQIFSCNYAV